jgi:putative membrane protein
MLIFFILGLMVGGVMVIFALQNTTLITVTFFFWQVDGSLALILLLTLISGVGLTVLILLPSTLSTYFKYRKLEKTNSKLEEDLRKQRELTQFAKKTPPTPEILTGIENGAVLDPNLPQSSSNV